MKWWKKLVKSGRRTNSSEPKNTGSASRDPVPPSSPIAFQPHNEIERLLIDATSSEHLRSDFQRALLDATLYAATPDIPDTQGERTTGAGEHLKILNVQSPDGTPVAAIFTAQERIVEVFGVDVGFVAIRGEVLLTMVADGGAWLNPGFPYSVYWTAEQLSMLVGKPLRRTIQTNTNIVLGVPSTPPAGLVQELKEVLSRDSRIIEAWFALAHWPGDGTSNWYLDVRTELAADAVGGMLAETFRRADFAGQPLDMVVNMPGGPEGVGIRLVPASTH